VLEGDVQALVDDVAAELGAAVSLVDLEERLIAHTAHDDVAVDDVRRAGILHRRLDPAVRSWFEQWGYREAGIPVRTPADTTLGILERWCVPTRFRGITMGYLWLIPGRELDESDLELAVKRADQIAAHLYRLQLLSQVDTDLLRLLLINTADDDGIAAEARALGTYTHEGPVAAVIAAFSTGGNQDSILLSDLALAVRRAAQQPPPGAVLAGVLWDTGVLLAPLHDKGDLVPARNIAEKILRFATHINNEMSIVIAIGGATELERASQSYAEARRTLRMVRAMADLGPIVAWDDLGVFRALSLVPPEQARSDVIDPRVNQLLADEGLAATADVFLNLAGDVQKTAARLYVHRTTLYQRLDRIAALYKLDLRRNGDHRLICHLGFKLASIAHASATPALSPGLAPSTKMPADGAIAEPV
jgi:hypothetical protein